MPESPAAQTPYEVLGVAAGASDDELRRAYRRLLRETHPDTGGDSARFVLVQRAWERIGTPELRAAYDRGTASRTSSPEPASYAAGARGSGSTARRPASSTVRARTYGHPGGQEREMYLALMREWVGRGVHLDDPYDPGLVQRAPREIRGWLAKAIAEETTSAIVGDLGVGFTIWNNVLTGRSIDGVGETIDHVVLGPSGLYAVQSEDWGTPVRLKKDDLVGEGIPAGYEPLHQLRGAARSLGRSLGVRFTGLVVVVPDDDLELHAAVVERGRLAGSAVVRRAALPQLLRDGTGADRESIDRVFDLRTRLQQSLRLA
ncbi:heat-shock protein [Humibacter sp. BT305]|nr:heat-shock protein [Humibacter sp. BT305]